MNREMKTISDARLLAAAPKLYEAAQSFINACDGHMPAWLGNAQARRSFDELRAALALAAGPQTDQEGEG